MQTNIIILLWNIIHGPWKRNCGRFRLCEIENTSWRNFGWRFGSECAGAEYRVDIATLLHFAQKYYTMERRIIIDKLLEHHWNNGLNEQTRNEWHFQYRQKFRDVCVSCARKILIHKIGCNVNSHRCIWQYGINSWRSWFSAISATVARCGMARNSDQRKSNKSNKNVIAIWTKLKNWKMV